MTNQFDYDLTMQATDIAYQPEQLSNEELEGVVGGSLLGAWFAGVNGSPYLPY
jgi:hypothetical protein